MTPLTDLTQALAKLQTANRIDGTRASYRKDNPTEYAKVIAYLQEGARPSSVVSDMGIGLMLAEDARRGLAGSPPPPPPPPPSDSWSGPITITQGGMYNGSWESTTSAPAITIATAQPVTITGRVRNLAGGVLIDALWTGTRVTLDHLFAYGGASWQTSGRFIWLDNPQSLAILNCTIENTLGIEVSEGLPGSTVLITRNKIHNIQGLGINPVGNFVQFRSVQNSTIEVSWNEVINEYNVSSPEDLISLYQSGNCNLHDNYFEGQSTPGNAFASSSQNGITIEAGTIPGSSSDNEVWNNQLVAGMAIGVFSGNDNNIHDNRVVRAGFLTDGVTVNHNGYEGMWIAPGFSNNHAHNNIVGYMGRADGGPGAPVRRDGRFSGTPEGDAGEWLNNTHMTGPITLAHEQAERDYWQQKLIDNSITLGA